VRELLHFLAAPFIVAHDHCIKTIDGMHSEACVCCDGGRASGTSQDGRLAQAGRQSPRPPLGPRRGRRLPQESGRKKVLLDGGPLFPSRLEAVLLRGYGEIAPLPSAYERHIRLTSILITVKALAYTLQRHPPDRFTQHQLQVLRKDLKVLE